MTRDIAAGNDVELASVRKLLDATMLHIKPSIRNHRMSLGEKRVSFQYRVGDLEDLGVIRESAKKAGISPA
ncbi:MAG: hypothetical protein ABJA62_01655 [Luteimonas sp.]